MASIGTLISCLVVMSLFLEAKSQIESFVKVDCKSSVVGHYGTDTVLECVIRTQKHITDTKIVAVTWKFNGQDTPVLFFHERSTRNLPGFQFAEASWGDRNMNVSLRITKTKLSHAGEYKCSVMTDRGDGDSKVQLSVQADYTKTKIKSSPEKIIANDGFNLTCETYGGYPKGDLRWVVDDQPWKVNPKVDVTKGEDGLFDLSSTLPLMKDSKYRNFVCEVFNVSGAKVAEEKFDYVPADRVESENPKPTPTQIVAPIVVIGSLIVGLLVVMLLCRRKHRRDHQGVPDDYIDDDRMMDVSPDNVA